MTIKLLCGDALAALKTLPDQSINCCVTSPPYWGLRDYGIAGQIGLERTPEEYTEKMTAVFREVRRVLRVDGTLWLNLGDCFNSYNGGAGPSSALSKRQSSERPSLETGFGLRYKGLKPKDLVGVPWRVAFALQSDGWYLRQDIIWHKPNPMPESVTDRCTRAHEYIFMLSKNKKYFYDADAIRLPPSPEFIQEVENGYEGSATKDFIASKAQDASATKSRIIEKARERLDKQRGHSRRHEGFNGRWDKMTKEEQMALGSNRRSVWTVAPANFKEAHFATFPPELIRPCILAGCPVGGTVLDPFNGAGTTGLVCIEEGRDYIGIELNPEYCAISEKRWKGVQVNLFPGSGV